MINHLAGNLKKHNELVHEGLKKSRCDKCGKLFGYASYLKAHNETVHEGRKKFRCGKCGKMFSAKHGLNYHITNTKCS